MTFVYISIAGFIVRGVWLLNGSVLFQHKITKILPHVIDTLLLISGISLAVVHSISPLQTPWLAAKLVAVVAYIGLGIVAFKIAKTTLSRTIAWMGAMAVFAYIMMVAVTKHVIPLM